MLSAIRATAIDLRLDTAAFGSGDQPDRRRTEALLGFVFDQTRVEISRGIAKQSAPDGRFYPFTQAPHPNDVAAVEKSAAPATRARSRTRDSGET